MFLFLISEQFYYHYRTRKRQPQSYKQTRSYLIPKHQGHDIRNTYTRQYLDASHAKCHFPLLFDDMDIQLYPYHKQ